MPFTLPKPLDRLYGALRPYAKEATEDDLSGAAAELAFRFFLALFPFLIFLAALGSFVADLFSVANPAEEVVDALGDSLPEDSAAVLTRQIEGVLENQNAGVLSLGILGAIWAASGAVGTIMKTMNRVYDVAESRPIWKRYAIALGLTFFCGGFLLLAVVALIFGEGYSRDLADALGFSDFYSDVLYLARWPATLVVVLLATAVFYWVAPAVKLPFRIISVGSVFFVLGWLVASFLFGIYVANFSSYNSTYGTLGTLVVGLLWAYITGFLMLAGGEIDAVRFQKRLQLSTEAQGDPGPVAKAPLPEAAATRAAAANALVVALATMVVTAGLWLSRRKPKQKTKKVEN